MNSLNNINRRLNSINRFIVDNGYESYDIFDGLNSDYLKWLRNFDNHILLSIWTQLNRYSPFNFRPIFGIKRIIHTKTISDFLSGYSILYKFWEEEDLKKQFDYLINFLLENSEQKDGGLGWGLRFPVVTRYVKTDEFTTNSFNTINVINSFLDAYEATHDEILLDYIMKGMLFEEDYMGYKELRDGISWNYFKGVDSEIYNISGLMLGLCSRVFQVTRIDKYFCLAKQLYVGLKNSQNKDGSWNYSSGGKGGWVDGFHTGYIIEGLTRGILAGVISSDNVCFNKGVNYYKRELFDDDFFPLYYPRTKYPIDSQNCAQAIQTLSFLSKIDKVKKDKILHLFDLVDSELWNNKGFYNHSKTRFLTYKIPMHRWATGPMFLALCHVISEK